MERITLNMVPTGVLEICHASQYDIGREIRFDLIDGTNNVFADCGQTTVKYLKAGA